MQCLRCFYLYFGGIQQVLNSDFLKFRILEILNFHPCNEQSYLAPYCFHVSLNNLLFKQIFTADDMSRQHFQLFSWLAVKEFNLFYMYVCHSSVIA